MLTPKRLEYQRAWRAKNPTYQRDWEAQAKALNPNRDRERYQKRIERNLHHARDQSRNWIVRRPEYRETIKAMCARWRKENPEKKKAQNIVQYAIQKGEFERQSCEICGVIETDCHHEDYDKPLDVRYLCRAHHVQLHAQKLIERSRASC